MRYYNVEDLMQLTGVKQNKCYEMIRNLNKKYKEKYPDCETIQGQIPIWFFNEAMGFKNEEIKRGE